MKSFYIVLILTTAVTIATGDIISDLLIWKYERDIQQIIQKRLLERLTERFGDFSNNLCDENINIGCVKNYFRNTGQCSVVNIRNRNAVYDTVLPVYSVNNDVTVIATKMHVSDMNGKIETFYMDRDTGNLVMSVNFDRIFIYAPDSTFIINNDEAEPIVFKEYVNATYSVIVTANIPARNGITATSLQEAMYSASIQPGGQVMLGPKFTDSQDPIVSRANEVFRANVLTSSKEVYITKASFDFLAYLQNYICDFGIAPDSIFDYDLTVVNSIPEDNNVDDIIEPCADSDDIFSCVLNYFEEQGSCSVISEPSNEPVYREKYVDYAPFLNASLILHDTRISGLDGSIKKFYINKKTDNLVIAVDFPALKLDISEAELILHQVGKPPNTVSDYSRPTFDVSLTGVINIKNGLTADAVRKSFVSTDLRSFTFQIGSNFSQSPDRRVNAIIDSLFTHAVTIGTEVFINEGPYCFVAFLQTQVCDFNIPLS